MRRSTGLLALTALAATSLSLTAPASAQVTEPAADLRLTLLHNNDGESALLPVAPRGGIARFGTLVDELRTQARTEGEVLLLSSGDNFLAGPQLQASLENFDGDVDFTDDGPFYDAVALDLLDYDASAVGNHEFDFGPAGLGYFISQFSDSNIRFVSANLDVSGEAALEQFVEPSPGTPGSLVEWTRTDVGGRSVAIVGATTPRLPSITSPGPDVEAREDVQGAVQDAIDAATADGTDVVVLIAHLQNVAEDQALVGALSGVDAVIAGGGDELLANPDDVLLPGAGEPFGPYPLLADNADGVRVPIVTTQGSYGYLGRLIIDIDAAGEVVGVDDRSGPVRNVFDPTTPPADQKQPDPVLLEQVERPVSEFVAALRAEVVAQTEVVLDARTPVNRSRETNLGSLFADALRETAEQGAPEFGAENPTVALQNSGGIRSDSQYGPGAVSAFDTFQIAPFSNFVGYTLGLSADKLKQLLERSVSANTTDGALQSEGRFGQLSGIELVYDPARPAQAVTREADGTVTITTPGQRVRSVTLTLGDDDPANDVVVVRNGAVVAGAPAVDLAANSFTVGQNGDNYPFNLDEGQFINLPTTYQQSLEDQLRRLGTVTAQDYPEGGLGRIRSVADLLLQRVDGSGLDVPQDRYATSAAIALDSPATGTVLLARGDDYADALSGNYLAGVLDAPVLLTRPGDLPEATRLALDALAPDRVVLLGGTDAISPAVQAEVAQGADVERVDGVDRYGTAQAVADRADDAGALVGEVDGLRTAVLASGQAFPDALAAAGVSYAEQLLLALTRPGALPAQTRQVLTVLEIEQVVIVGGTDAVSAAVQAEAEQVVGRPAVRLDGTGDPVQTVFDRYATARDIAVFAYDELDFDATRVHLARGDEPADALAAGPRSGAERAPLLLTRPDELPAPTADLLRDRCTQLTGGLVFGGTDAVGEAVVLAADPRPCAG